MTYNHAEGGTRQWRMLSRGSWERLPYRSSRYNYFYSQESFEIMRLGFIVLLLSIRVLSDIILRQDMKEDL